MNKAKLRSYKDLFCGAQLVGDIKRLIKVSEDNVDIVENKDLECFHEFCLFDSILTLSLYYVENNVRCETSKGIVFYVRRWIKTEFNDKKFRNILISLLNYYFKKIIKNYNNRHCYASLFTMEIFLLMGFKGVEKVYKEKDFEFNFTKTNNTSFEKLLMNSRFKHYKIKRFYENNKHNT